MPNANPSGQPEPTGRTTESEKDKQEREHVCNLPDAEDIPPDQERGERIGTAKTIATGGKGDEACEQPRQSSREAGPQKPP